MASNMSASFLDNFDWSAAWADSHPVPADIDKRDVWDKRAKTFGSVTEPSPYATAFAAQLGLLPGETVLDMGCGNGIMAIPLAQQGHHVIACDFSNGMLDALRASADALGVRNIATKQMRWEDDWEEFGLGSNTVDVAFASRSFITADLAGSLDKLTRAARRKACLTAATGYTPKISPAILEQLGAHADTERCFIYVFNILVNQGRYPEVSYIINDRRMHFDTLQEGTALLAKMVDAAVTEVAEHEKASANIVRWIEDHARPNPLVGTRNHHDEIEGRYEIVMPSDIRWACISWDTNE